VLVTVSGAGPHYESMGYSPLMGVDAAAKPDTVRQAPGEAKAVAERPSTGHRHLPALLVLVTLGLVATGISLVAAALLVRALAGEQSGTTKVMLISGGTAVGTFALGLVSERAVTRMQRAASQQAAEGQQ